MALFGAGVRFWNDVEDADNEICIIDSTLDKLSDQLKYTLMPSFITACMGGAGVIMSYFMCIWCPFGFDCCGHLVGVKDETKYYEWKRQQQLNKNNNDHGSCSCSGTWSCGSGGSCSVPEV